MKFKKSFSLAIFLAIFCASASSAVLLEEITPKPFSDKDVNLTASLVEFADPVEESDAFGVKGAVWKDGRLYMLHQEGNLDCYVLEGDFLVRDPKAFGGKGTVKLDKSMECLQMDNQGWFYASASSFQDLYIVEPNGTVHKMKDGKSNMGKLWVHPSGEWGVRVSGKPSRLADLVKAKAGEAEFSAEMANLSTKKGALSTSFDRFTYFKINSDGSCFVSGSSPKVKGQGYWGVLDKDYKEVFAFLEKPQSKDPRCIGSVSEIITCKQGYAVLDGNLRRLHFYGKDFAHITTADLRALLGLNYCWPSAAVRIDDDTVLVVCTQDFPKGSRCAEALVMKVKGL